MDLLQQQTIVIQTPDHCNAEHIRSNDNTGILSSSYRDCRMLLIGYWVFAVIFRIGVQITNPSMSNSNNDAGLPTPVKAGCVGASVLHMVLFFPKNYTSPAQSSSLFPAISSHLKSAPHVAVAKHITARILPVFSNDIMAFLAKHRTAAFPGEPCFLLRFLSYFQGVFICRRCLVFVPKRVSARLCSVVIVKNSM